VQGERNAKRIRRALASVIVGRRAYAAKAENEIPRGERALERGGNETGLVAEILAPVEPHAARRKDRDELRKMLVFSLAADDLVADDDRADPHTRLAAPSIGSARSSPSRARP
jgi:hypothetical protein